MIAIDSSKKLLLNTLKYHPFIIKPSLAELSDYFDVSIDNNDDIQKYMLKLQELGARNILCSLAENGAILLSEEKQFYYHDTPKKQVLNSLGSGDSMLAGFIYEYTRSKDYLKALKMAIACGSSTAFSNTLASKRNIRFIKDIIKSFFRSFLTIIYFID